MFSNTAAFLQSQTDQHRAAAPTRMRFLNCFGIPLSHPPNRFATLEGLLMPQAACNIDQTILDRRQQKKEMLNCLIFVAKTTFLGALPVPPCKIILSEYDPSPKVPKEDFNFKQRFQFPQLLIIVGNIPVD